jgi:hypothetical protein
VRIISLGRQSVRPQVHTDDLRLVVFQARRADNAMLFCHQPPLRFVVLLLLAGPFLFTLLKGPSRFIRHRVPRPRVPSLDHARLRIVYAVS